mgnify:CR=1 FL=1
MTLRTYKRIKDFINKTPLEYNLRLSEIYGCNVFLKREDLQITRSFKIRGALNKVLKNKDKYNKFVCASAGNHAQGVAYSCNLLNLKSKIYVPEITPFQKINAILKQGNGNMELIKYGQTFDETLNYALKNKKEDELFIHPYDDNDIIEGHSTIGFEILQDIKPDIILSCIGGGGLISGLFNYYDNDNVTNGKYYNGKYYNGNKDNNIDIIGVEPLGADSMNVSLENNKIIKIDDIDTFVDGASVSRVGERTFNICKRNNLDIKLVTNNEICYNMIELYNNEGIITEPAGALTVSGLSKLDKKYIKNKNVVCIVSGGNNDIMRYPEIMEKNLMYLNIKHYFIIEFNQKPNELKIFINNVLSQNDDITRFEYIKKTNKSYGKVLIGIDTLDIETLIYNMEKYDYKFIILEEDNIIYNYLV